MSENKKNAFVTEVQFIMDECMRLGPKVSSSSNLKQIPRDDYLFTLPHPAGRGEMICGKAAAQAVGRLADEAARRSGITGQVDRDTIRKPLERLLVSRFFNENRAVDVMQVDRILASAAKQAKSNLATIVHLIPCHLMRGGEPDELVFGPVKFMNRSGFRKLILDAQKITRNSARTELELRRRELLPRAIRYYRHFEWVAQVEVTGCDVQTSADVATNAVVAALDCLHVLLGPENTDRMQVGGVGLSRDIRAKLTISGAGAIEPSLSYAPFGHVEYQEGWSDILKSDHIIEMMRLCGIALEAATTPNLQRPLSRRFLDAVQWFGEGCRDDSPSTRTIKFMTSVERLLTTGEHDDIAGTLAERTANLCFSQDESRDQWREKTARAYDYRSRLVHGSMSPRHPDIWRGAHLSGEVSLAVLRNALRHFGEAGFTSTKLTEKRLAQWFGDVAEWAQRCESSFPSELGQ
ncbi:hypothetical protein [Achromobacter sp. ESBL13]|uniref:hypothetical protein n=1 Tax=Achromobacter sp. ESBL13 TaxID=3077328 RepID=UPI002FCA1639